MCQAWSQAGTRSKCNKIPCSGDAHGLLDRDETSARRRVRHELRQTVMNDWQELAA